VAVLGTTTAITFGLQIATTTNRRTRTTISDSGYSAPSNQRQNVCFQGNLRERLGPHLILLDHFKKMTGQENLKALSY